MSFVGDIIGDVVGGVTGAKQQGEAAMAAAQTQAGASEAGIAEQRRQFDALVKLMEPYVTAGYGGISGQQSILGLKGQNAQQTAINELEQSPLFQALSRQGENALLQQASATGGIRGGNIQAALAQYRPQMLQQVIDQQYNRLGGLAQLGQASASGQAAQGMSSANSISNLLANQGAAIAGGQIAQGGVNRQAFGDLLGIAKTIAAF